MPDITDEQIAAAVRPLYTDDAAASMGLADDIRTARAVLALRPSASAAPGWKVVPVEPTDDMETAAENCYEQTHSYFPDWKSAYRAMLSASPPPPTEETVEADRASEVKFEIETQGAPVVNHAWRENSETAVVLIDMRSKYCEVSWYGNDLEEVPSIGISASDRSLHLDETKDRDDLTGLRFPEFKGWRIIATDLGRYTLTVMFARRAQEEET